MSEQALPARSRWPVRVAAWLIAASVVIYAAYAIDIRSLGSALRAAGWGWVVVAALVNLVANTGARVRRWQALLEPIPHRQPASFLDLARLLCAGGVVNNLLPARAGEALRVVELHRRRGYPAGALIAAQLAEKGIEAISLGLACGAFALLPGAHRPLLALVGGLAAAAAAVLAVLPRQAPGAAGRFLEALRAVHAERSWVRALLWSTLSDVIDLLLVGLCLRALAIDVSPPVWALILVSINLAILLPSTPAQVGVLEAGAVVALTASGIAAEPALAFALVYHAIHLVPSTALGALAFSLPAK